VDSYWVVTSKVYLLKSIQKAELQICDELVVYDLSLFVRRRSQIELAIELLNYLPQFEVLSFGATDLVIVLLLGDSVSFSLNRWLIYCLKGSTPEPLSHKHPAHVLLELEDDLLHLYSHILLLNSLQLGHRLFNEFEHRLILHHCFILACQKSPQSFFCLLDVNFVIGFLVTTLESLSITQTSIISLVYGIWWCKGVRAWLSQSCPCWCLTPSWLLVKILWAIVFLFVERNNALYRGWFICLEVNCCWTKFSWRLCSFQEANRWGKYWIFWQELFEQECKVSVCKQKTLASHSLPLHQANLNVVWNPLHNLE